MPRECPRSGIPGLKLLPEFRRHVLHVRLWDSPPRRRTETRPERPLPTALRHSLGCYPSGATGKGSGPAVRRVVTIGGARSDTRMRADDFRRIALAMTDAVEGAHMGHPDFRVKGKIFAR
jgi:hypothetical protein